MSTDKNSESETNSERNQRHRAKHQEECHHEFVTYTSCCYCGYCKNGQGEVIQPYVASNMKDLSDEFSAWYFTIKEESGNPPLAMQIFYWFSQRMRCNLFEYEDEIKILTQKIEDYKYVCEVDKIPKLIIENPGWMRSIKITPFSELTGDERQWAQEVIDKYESGENKVVTHEEEIERLQKTIDLKESERKQWADMCIKKQSVIEEAYENLILGNRAEVAKVIYSALNKPQPKTDEKD